MLIVIVSGHIQLQVWLPAIDGHGTTMAELNAFYSTNYPLHSTDYHVQITDYPVCSTDYPLHSTDYHVDRTDYP